jgi:hypothetical protein
MVVHPDTNADSNTIAKELSHRRIVRVLTELAQGKQTRIVNLFSASVGGVRDRAAPPFQMILELLFEGVQLTLERIGFELPIEAVEDQSLGLALSPEPVPIVYL